MIMDRRAFLTRSGLALGALIVGDEVGEMLERLSHRKVFAGHTFTDISTATHPAWNVSLSEGGTYFTREWYEVWHNGIRVGNVTIPDHINVRDYIIKAHQA